VKGLPVSLRPRRVKNLRLSADQLGMAKSRARAAALDLVRSVVHVKAVPFPALVLQPHFVIWSSVVCRSHDDR
jgi:hypothetical protein